MFSQIGIEFYVGLKNWFREGVVPQNEALPDSLQLAQDPLQTQGSPSPLTLTLLARSSC